MDHIITDLSVLDDPHCTQAFDSVENVMEIFVNDQIRLIKLPYFCPLSDVVLIACISKCLENRSECTSEVYK